MVIFSLYCIGMTLFYSGLPETRLAAFLAMIVFIGFLTYPVKKGHVKVNSMPWYDIILMLVGASCFLYFAFNALPIIKLATRIQTHHVIIGRDRHSGPHRALPPLRRRSDPVRAGRASHLYIL